MINIYTTGAPRPPGGIPTQDVETINGQRVVDSYYPFQPSSEPLAVVQAALGVIEERTSPEAVLNSCDQAFRNFDGTSFSELFYGDALTVTVFRNPTNHRDLAVTKGQGRARHLSLSPATYALNPQAGVSRDELILTCAATLLHEFAHCVGAPGHPSRAAENTLLVCGFQDRFNPLAIG